MENKKPSMDEHICYVCNKHYSSYKSLWNHNKEFHSNKIIIKQLTKHNVNNVNTNVNNVNTNVNNVNTNVNNDNIITNNKVIFCDKCNKTFTSRQAKSLHNKKYCKVSNNELDKIKEETKQKEEETKQKQEETKQKELEVILKKEEARILKLKLKLQQSDKIDNITLNKLNKMLQKHNNRIKNSTVNSHNTINNIQNVQNNFQLVGFGKEEITELLTNNEKKLIMNSKYGCLEKLIEIVHCGKYSQFKNVILTNMKDNYMYKYDDTKGCFILGTKSEIMNTLVDGKLFDLDVIYNDLLEKNKIDDRTKNCIEDFVNRIHNNDEKFTDIDGKEHDNYKHYKINEIKLLLFNNQDKITNDISLLLSTE
jgi:hypothetical protein